MLLYKQVKREQTKEKENNMYTIELNNGKVKANIETVKFKNKKDACEWIEDFKKFLTPNIKAKVVKCNK